MTWKLTEFGKTRLPLMGVEWRDLSDEEFAAAEARHPELRERGYFASEEAPPEPAAAAAPSEPAAREMARAHRRGTVASSEAETPERSE